MFYLGAGFLIAVDQITKIVAASTLPYGVPQPVLPFLRLTYVTNTGAAFSLFTAYPWILAGVVAVIAAGILGVVVTRGRHLGVRLWPLLLIFSGAVGNLIDRLTRGGSVVDFLEFGPADASLPGWFPVFNVADSMVVIGAVLLVLMPGGDGRGSGRRRQPGPQGVDPRRQPPGDGETADPQVGGPGDSASHG